MSFDVINATKNITHKYTRYLRTMFDIEDKEYKKLFEKEIDSIGSFSKGPYLDVVDSFESGSKIQDLIDEEILNKDFKFIKDIYEKTLYVHQEKSIRRLLKGNNIIVSTGTGSGKTESFLIPILNYLMVQKEKNKSIGPGVRALLVYPMNALANDQVSRLRNCLKDYPYITFGAYTGQTLEKNDAALSKYMSLNNGRKPLKNELISREQMKETPPHILITNYSMLEYLMLRPQDNTFFQGNYSRDWKFIVLDEAHTYSGSTGIEVSMLLRRLEAYLDKKQLQFILTSATLGSEETNDDVVEFGRRLCNADFYDEDVIRASRVKLAQNISEDVNFSAEDYKEINDIVESGYDDLKIIDMLKNYTGFQYKTSDYSEYLFELLIKDSTFWNIKNFLKSPKTIKSICSHINWSEQEVGIFVNVASKAIKNRKKLFDSRYHMFIRATDGVYITLGEKKLSLTRENATYIDGETYKYFEIVTCMQCHAIYLLGAIESRHGLHYLVQKSNIDSERIREAFLLGDQVNDEDGDDTLEDELLNVNHYELCPHCGFIREANQVHKISCEHSQTDYIKLVKVSQSNTNGRVTKCIKCESSRSMGILRHFFSGQEASTSVIGTALFEELPNKEVTIKTYVDDSGFDDGFEDNRTNETKTIAKQFIAFSDNRQAAAFFATYFDETYQGFLYSKIINDNIKKIDENGKPLVSFVNSMYYDFKNNKISPLDDLHPDYGKEAWKAMLRELINIRSRNSLFGLGLIKIDFNDDVIFSKNKNYNLSEEEVKTICLIYVQYMLSENAIYHGQKFSEADISFYTNNNAENSYVFSNPKNKYLKSFIPKNDFFTNKRLEYLQKILLSKGFGVNRDKAIMLLKGFWDHFFIKLNLMVNNSDYESMKFDISKLKVVNSNKWYRCNKCNRLTPYNISNLCPTYKCDGLLEAVDIDSLEKENHYYRIYNDLSTQPLRVVEHTAQLSNEKAYKLQERFKNQEIDVLSCSTTFEMGVDIGDLETVFMRNMPPTPSNYIQRAGRAGRSLKSAALALTFCNKSNHDFNFFNNPISMINGEIDPPLFKVENEKICIRHLYSVAFSFFWKKYPEYFGTISNFFDNEKNNETGYDLFKAYLDSKPNDLRDYLLKAIPEELISKYEVGTFGWIKWLIDEPINSYPNLNYVYILYKNEIASLYKEKERLDKEEKPNNSIIYRLNTYKKENIITFLSRNNILPKYGFPVDTVDLEILSDKTNSANLGIELSRDLSMAISEYAPGCDVVAAGKLITSRYIKMVPSKAWKSYDFVQCPACKTLTIDIHTDSTENVSIYECRKCKNKLEKSMIKTFIIPEFGFASEHKLAKPTLVKPEKTYRGEASSVNYGNIINEEEYLFNDIVTKVSTAEDGEIAILNSSNFYVCEQCGYSLSSNEAKAFTQSIKKEHKNISGYKCKNNYLKRYYLGYRFKTDIIILNIDLTMRYEQAYSVLQALILAISHKLNIDNGEIAGCLQYTTNNSIPTYDFVLYDTTPGGAGHVKRIASKDRVLDILKSAYNIANTCNCGGEDKDISCYNCLRTYQNQKFHDIIKRKYVIDLLGAINEK